MNLYDVREELAKKYPSSKVTMRFTDACKKRYDISIQDGKPSLSGYILYDKVQVEVEGSEPYLVKISNHRQSLSFVDFKSQISAFQEPNISSSVLDNLAEEKSENLASALENLAFQSGISSSELLQRVEARKADKQKLEEAQEIPILVG